MHMHQTAVSRKGVWSIDGAVAMLRQMLHDGHIYDDIARKISRTYGVHITAGAISSKASRIGYTRRPRDVDPPDMGISVRMSRWPGPPDAPVQEAAELLRVEQKIADEARSRGDLVNLVDLEDTHCRYPIAGLFCGRLIVPGTSYCRHHLIGCTEAPTAARPAIIVPHREEALYAA